MEKILLVLVIALLSINLLLTIIISIQNSKAKKVSTQDYNKDLGEDLLKIKNLLEIYNVTTTEILKSYNDANIQNLNIISSNQLERLDTIGKKIEVLTSNLESRLEKNSNVLELGLTALRQNNEQKLEQMRITVDEKLNESLERRLNESFDLISKRLQSVSEGLGEMKSLASNVGDLKKVLTNVKTRGTFGEIQLGTLLEQILAPNQYEANVTIKEDKRVDYVIKLPGKDDKEIFLPIDAKFPIEDYNKIIDAETQNNSNEVLQLEKALERRIKEEAKKISEKYIYTSKTTDFAIMYLPLEGLYAEAIKRPDLIQTLQRDYRIIVCGPTTLSALLNSLQMGFQTLAIEKRSSEIWSLLSTFKKEFVNFTMLLAKTQKKIDEASDTISDATKKTQKIQRQLNKVVLTGDETSVNLIDIDPDPQG